MSNTPPPLPPSAPPPPLPAQGEIVRLVLEKITRKTGVFSKETYKLAVTDRRLIFALQAKTNADLTKLTPDLILSQNPKNFAVPLEAVAKINTYQAGMDDSSPDTMEVITASDKLKFEISNYHKIRKQLKELLGTKVS